MSRPYLIIDGYNLMHAAGLARRTYAPGQLERCRSRLLRYLASHLATHERERTTIVFDAAEAPADLPRQWNFQGMTVCFASPGKDADDTIEELIAAHSAPRQIRLISSDHRLQRSVRRRRGSFVDSEDFVRELERRAKSAEPPRDVSSPDQDLEGLSQQDPDVDTERWLSIFADAVTQSEVALDTEDSNAFLDQAEIAAIEKEIELESQRDIGRSRRERRVGKRKRN